MNVRAQFPYLWVAEKTNKDNFLFKQFPITFSRHIQISSMNGVYVFCPFDSYSHDCNICDKVKQH